MDNNPFFSVSIHNATDHQVDLLVPPDDGPLPSPNPVSLPDGRFGVPVIQPQDEVRHTVLGIFMDEWSKLEMQVARLLALGLQSDFADMPVLMNALGSQGQREAIQALLLPRLNDATGEKLAAALDKLKEHTTRRNRIAHGFWHLEVVIANRNGVPWANYRQYRRYNPSDLAVRQALEIREPSPARKSYLFSIPRIRAISAELARLWHDLAAIDEESFGPATAKSAQMTLKGARWD